MQFIISTTDEVLVPQAGLGLVGALLQDTKLRRRVDAIEVEGCLRPKVKHGDVVTAAIGLLCLGKTDFTDIEPFREDEFFRQGLGLREVPSEATLRQRLDAMQDACGPILREESALLVRKHARKVTPCHGPWVALDVDVSPFDNSGTKKEGVSWTYKKVDGYAPIFAYLGEEGYLVHCQLREGKQHCQDGTPQFLDEALGYAEQITRAPLLVRLDAGNDDIENIRICRRHKADWIIKRNLRQESLEDWLEEAQAHGTSEQYHSEIKTDLDLERLPSGKFATNATMLSLALVAYNVLRLCGQAALQEQRRLPPEQRAPLGKKVFRRRLRSVIQDLMYLAAKLVRHANRWKLAFWRNSPWGTVWRGLYGRFCGSPYVRSG